MIITISGTPGSGKSTIAKILQSELKAERLCAGAILREKAREKNMSLQELLRLAEDDPSFDKEVDQEIAKQATSMETHGKNIIVEGRMQFHFIAKSIKVFITVSPEEGARRIFNDLQNPIISEERNEHYHTNQREVEIETEKRKQNDQARYLKLYDIDYLDPKNYDIMIDTTSITPNEAVEQILEYLR